jgi:site-specific DNA recombinase
MKKEINNNLKYFIYARKSSESEDRQMASIDDQINELKKLAGDNNLNVIEILSESKSAKNPGGRIVFNKMLERIHNGEAQGIICWKLNRLARNPVDGGNISWMLQQGTIQHIQTYGRSYYPIDNVLMMAVELGMANQFIRDLSTDTKRGLRAKAERGWSPSYATLGYMHNKYKLKGDKEILDDPERFHLVRKMWDLMLTGKYSPNKIWLIARNDWNLTSRLGNKIACSTVYRIFSNPFYYGEYEYPSGSGKWIAGNHNKMITRAEFDKVQVLLGNKVTQRPKTHNFAFRGPITCGECGALVTAETKTKKQKNGNVHTYTYYHCTKRKNPDCSQGCIEETELQKQISNKLNEIELPDDFCTWALDVLRTNNVVEAHSRTEIVNSQRIAYDKTLIKLDALVDMRASGTITDEEFLKSKTTFLEEKHRIEMLMKDTGARADNWLDLVDKQFEFAKTAKTIFDTTDSLEVKKDILSALGSNLTLKDKILNVTLEKPLLLIKEASDEIKTISNRLEPVKEGSVSIQNSVLYTEFTTRLRRLDSNQRPIA